MLQVLQVFALYLYILPLIPLYFILYNCFSNLPETLVTDSLTACFIYPHSVSDPTETLVTSETDLPFGLQGVSCFVYSPFMF